jgi:hypothetical protein
MRIGDKHRELVASAREHGILLRDRSTDPGCDGFVRITIGIADHVTQGLAALGAALAQISWVPQVSNLSPETDPSQTPDAGHEPVLAGEREYE